MISKKDGEDDESLLTRLGSRICTRRVGGWWMCQYLWVALGGSNVARGRGFSTCPSSPAHTNLQCQPLITLTREEGSSVWRFHMKFVANLANQTLLMRRLSFLDSTLLFLAFQAFCVQFGCYFISQSLPSTAADNESNSISFCECG